MVARTLKQTPRAAPGSSDSITKRTYETVLEMILSRAIAPREVIEERRLADHLAVSRTPLRSALSQLLGEGYIDRLSNGALIAVEIGRGEFLELIHLRRILEGEAASMAAGRVDKQRLTVLRKRIREVIRVARADKQHHWLLDDELHDVMADACGSASLARTIRDVRRRVRMCNIERNPGRLVPACREHVAIIDALIKGNGAEARAAMETHLDNVRDAFLQSLAPGPIPR